MKRASKYFCYAIGSAAVLLIAAEMGLRFTPFPAGLASPPPGSTEFLDRNGASSAAMPNGARSMISPRI
ncbi:MAG: hypothetical protein MUC40_10475 [Akkermansiaceae bacterium]|nr:hypothetical protein [Akkermansiaceae bacterium]